MKPGRAKGQNGDRWLQSHADLSAIVITALAFLVRLWSASGTFLNPDEALHFRLANQLSLALAYRESLTAAHPPGLILLLYYWRALGTSELWLRVPSVIAGAVFCWMFYKWLSKAAGQLTGLIGLLLVGFLPPIVVLFAEVRQYPWLLAFLAGALYFLDDAFAKSSPWRMGVFSICLYAAMLFHYSAFLFAAALGIYALIRIFQQRMGVTLIATWVAAQVGALALAAFFYKTHLSLLESDASKTVLQGWMSDIYLQHSFFNRANNNPLAFLIGHSFGVFQYFFGQLVVGDLMGVVFLAGIALLLRGDGFAEDQISSRRLGIFLLLPFAIVAGISLAHLYPYGGTRHVAFLIIPAITGVSVALGRLAARSAKANSVDDHFEGKQWLRGIAIAACIIVACVVFGKLRQPRMTRANQSITHMTAAIQFVRQNAAPSDLIFTDYQTDLVLGHYLCDQRPIVFDPAPLSFEQFSCSGLKIVSTNFLEWMFTSQSFPLDWHQFEESYKLKTGESVWIVQAGWGLEKTEDVRRELPESNDGHLETFGKNIRIFKMTIN